MERFHSCTHDDALAVQLSDSRRARIAPLVSAMKLREIGEDALLQKLLKSLPAGERVIAGVGDDVAIVRQRGRNDVTVLKTDAVVERVHFGSKASPEAVGWKAMMRPLSDFAAVSAVPEFALITLMVSRQRT